MVQYINSELASVARGHVEDLVMVFCGTCRFLGVCGEICRSHTGILAALGL